MVSLGTRISRNLNCLIARLYTDHPQVTLNCSSRSRKHYIIIYIKAKVCLFVGWYVRMCVGRSVGIVRSRTEAREFFISVVFVHYDEGQL
jgi:hypothetical protein